MTMQDPISDMLVRIKNAAAVGKPHVSMPSSKIKVSISELLKREGYILGFNQEPANDIRSFPELTLQLKYMYKGPQKKKRSVIRALKRVSRCGCRVYSGYDKLPKVDNGLGVAVVSTPSGIKTDSEAFKLKMGGEVLFIIS